MTMVLEKHGKILECSLDNIELLLLQITSTNAKRSISFSNACCLYDMIKDNEHGLFWSLKLTTLFEKGVKFLSNLKTVTPEEIEKMDIHKNLKAAVELLDNFLKTKDEIEESLHKVLRSNSKSPTTETDINIVLAEHLLGKLAPGGSYVIDANTKNKDSCRCGCGVYPAFESTGIGHEEVWHGHVDMILSSHRGFPEESLCDGIPVHCYTDISDAGTAEDDSMPSASLDETPFINLQTFDDLLELAEQGDHREVDMLVKDIYGGAYSSIGLSGDIIASSFGKAARSPKKSEDQETGFEEADIARSLLLSISNDIGQIAYLHAKLHGLNKIYFGGYFIRGHPLTMHTITFAINFWSKGEINALFLRHEGYLGAIGAFIRGAKEEDTRGLTWGENLAGSSGLGSHHKSHPWREKKNQSSTFEMLELNQLDRALLPCPLLLDQQSYLPDTVELTEDIAAREYWLECFMKGVHKTQEQAIKSQQNHPDAMERAEKFTAKYIERLTELKENPCAYGSLTVRSLLDTSSHYLQEFMFNDPYLQLKQTENEQSLKYLAQYFQELDRMNFEDRQLALAKGVIAGNVFDWGAREVTQIMETQSFGFKEATEKLQERPWLFDDLDAWLSRIKGKPHKCAAIFIDNSGADIILGIFPFIRDMLSRGTKVILCANSRPALNDVIYNELVILVKRVAEIDPQINEAYSENRLMVMETGQGSPCLDLRLIDCQLVDLMNKEETDLVVIEGMGRAIHTNFDACFSCEALKIAVIKNRWLANRLGGDMFSVMFKYEAPRKIYANTA